MEENQPKIGRFALNYGLLLGGFGLVFGIMLYLMDIHYQDNWSLQVVGLIITIVILYIGINQFKKANGGYLTLGQAIKIGVLAALISGIIGVLYQIILANYLDPDFMDKVLELRTSNAVAEGSMTSEQAAQQVEMGKKFWWIGYPIYLFISMLIGFIVALVLGLILKKLRPAY